MNDLSLPLSIITAMASNPLEDEMNPNGPHSDPNNGDKLSSLESSESGYAESVETDSINPRSEIMTSADSQVDVTIHNTDDVQTPDGVETLDSGHNVVDDKKDIHSFDDVSNEDGRVYGDIVGENERSDQVGEGKANPEENMNSSRQTHRMKKPEEPPPNEAVISKEKLPTLVSIEI